MSITEQLVCWTKTCASPQAIPARATISATASVISTVPRPRVVVRPKPASHAAVSAESDALIARDKTNLDIFWLKDEDLEASENLPSPDVLAQEIIEDLEVALEAFRSVEDRL